MSSASIAPIDPANRKTIAQGHPPDWKAPRPKELYDLVVIGGGPAGLSAAFGAAKAGRSVALAERDLPGGTCANFGCTPSKALLRAGRAVFGATDGRKFGYALDAPPRVDFAAVMTRVRELRAWSTGFDSAEKIAEAGIDLFLGSARFVGPDTAEVDGDRLRFRRALIAAGTRPALPDLPGLDSADTLTNQTVFELTDLPRRLVFLGGGPVSCELAQAFRRLGAEVDLVTHGERLLPHEVPEVSEILVKRFEAEGLRVHLGAKAERVDGGSKRLLLAGGAALDYDAIFIGTGRMPNLDGLGLEAAGVRFSAVGIEADDRFRTANPAIYAAGDVSRPEKYTHAAEAFAKLALANALDGADRSSSELVIPRCTYTDPEVAHVGLTPAEADELGTPVEVHRTDLAKYARPVIDGETDGFAALYTRDGAIVGATLMSAHAGESIPLLTLAVMNRMTPADLAKVIHCFPTQAEAVMRLAAKTGAGG